MTTVPVRSSSTMRAGGSSSTSSAWISAIMPTRLPSHAMGTVSSIEPESVGRAIPAPSRPSMAVAMRRAEMNEGSRRGQHDGALGREIGPRDRALDDRARRNAPRGEVIEGGARAARARRAEGAEHHGALRRRIDRAVRAEQRRLEEDAACEAARVAERAHRHIEARPGVGAAGERGDHHHGRGVAGSAPDPDRWVAPRRRSIAATAWRVKRAEPLSPVFARPTTRP
jgi:hypothetical protein